MVDISVIVPLYKGSKYINGLINNINNNMTNYCRYYEWECEIIFVNDYPDEIVDDVLSELHNNLRIKIYNMEDNRGIHGARVFGFLKSSGRYVIFLDQDDKIDDDYLLQQRRKIEGYDAVVCNAYMGNIWTNMSYRFYKDKKALEDTTKFKNYVKIGNQISSPGQVLIKREAIPDLWCENILSLNGLDDYFLWVLMLKRGAHFNINQNCAYFHINNGNNASKNIPEMLASLCEVKDALERMKILSADEMKAVGNYYEKMVEENGNKDNRKVSSITTIYDQWMYINSKGYKISNYFETNNCYNIAIYGMGCLGNRLYEELKGSSIRVIFGVDKNAKIMRHEIPICMVESDDFNQWSGQVDMMVVAALSANNEIKTILQNKFYKPIVSLADIIAEMMEIN